MPGLLLAGIAGGCTAAFYVRRATVPQGAPCPFCRCRCVLPNEGANGCAPSNRHPEESIISQRSFATTLLTLLAGAAAGAALMTGTDARMHRATSTTCLLYTSPSPRD